MYDYSGLPETLQGGMKRYVEDGIRPGGFLTACLENDLMGAVNRADETNLPRLREIVKWIHWEVPDGCWGSVEKVYAWMDSQYLATSRTELIPEHECEKFLSVCCGVYEVEETGCCGKCHDHTGFECEECGKEQND